MATTPMKVTKAVEKLQNLEGRLNEFFIGREEVVHTSLLALMTRQHHLQVGPPGTAKSMLVRSIAGAFNGTIQYSEKLMHRMLEPDDLFGMLDLEEARKGNAWRNTKGSVVTADIFFADELYRLGEINASPLLSVVNERRFPNGKGVDMCQLVSMFAGTNELYEGTTLDAFHSRILFKHQVDYVDLNRFEEFFNLMDNQCETEDIGLQRTDLDTIYKYLSKVRVSKTIMRVLGKIRQNIIAKELPLADTMDDRKVVAILSALRAQALLMGRNHVAIGDVVVLAHCLWSKPEQAKAVAEIVYEASAPWVPAIQNLQRSLEKEVGMVRVDASDADLMTLASVIKGLQYEATELGRRYEKDIDEAGAAMFSNLDTEIKEARKETLTLLGVQ